MNNQNTIKPGMTEKVCGTYFNRDRNDFYDETGCLLPQGHNGPHRCKEKHGRIVEWEYDFDCGCDDCKTDDFSDMCIVYEFLKGGK